MNTHGHGWQGTDGCGGGSERPAAAPSFGAFGVRQFLCRPVRATGVRKGGTRSAALRRGFAWAGTYACLCLTTLALTSGCATPPATPPVSPKIIFDLSVLNADGLQGPADGKRALAYEFCIPARPECRDDVSALDSTVEFHAQSPGRIGCGTNQVLCIGSTHQPAFEDVLRGLAALPYVERIQECFFE